MSPGSSSDSKDYEFMGRVNGKEAALVGVFCTRWRTRSNSPERQERCGLSPHASPTAMTYSVPTTRRASWRCQIREVLKTLAEGDGARVPRRVPVPAELAREP